MGKEQYTAIIIGMTLLDLAVIYAIGRIIYNQKKAIMILMAFSG